MSGTIRPAIIPSSSYRELTRFENLLDVGEEAFGVGAVHGSVVEGECEVGHVANGYYVVAFVGGDDLGALLYGADAEYGDLRLVDDGRAEEAAEDAGVGDGEGAARDLVGLELFGARGLRGRWRPWRVPRLRGRRRA